MRDRWLNLTARFGHQEVAEPLYCIIESLYAHPPRPYHNLTHISACLDLLDRCRSLTQQPDAIELALWMHDCVYVPGRKDNEERSAQIARVFARELNVAPAQAAAIEAWILATRHTQPPASPDEALVLDIDMAILASPADVYDAYTNAIRREFALATDEQFKAGRAAFLKSQLAQPAVFFTPALKAELEPPARANMERELAALS